jgi:hypothetical protein
MGAVSAYAVHILHAGGWSEASCEQFIRRVCVNSVLRLEKQTLAHFHVTEAHMSHVQGRQAEVRHHVAYAIKYHPRQAIDRGLQSIAADALVGPSTAQRLRSTARRVRRREV